MRLLKEVGAIGNPDPTYELSDINPVDLIDEDVALCERFGLKLDEGQKTLPTMYWTPKMHYTPSRARSPLVELYQMHLNLFSTRFRIFMIKVSFIKITTVFGLLRTLSLSLRGWMLSIPGKKLKTFQPMTLAHCIRSYPMMIFSVYLMSTLILLLTVALANT